MEAAKRLVSRTLKAVSAALCILFLLIFLYDVYLILGFEAEAKEHVVFDPVLILILCTLSGILTELVSRWGGGPSSACTRVRQILAFQKLGRQAFADVDPALHATTKEYRNALIDSTSSRLSQPRYDQKPGKHENLTRQWVLGNPVVLDQAEKTKGTKKIGRDSRACHQRRNSGNGFERNATKREASQTSFGRQPAPTKKNT